MTIPIRARLFFFSLFGIATLGFYSAVADSTMLPRFLMLSAAFPLAWWGLFANSKSRNGHTPDLLDILVVGLYLACMVSALWAYSPAEAVFEAQRLLLLAVTYFTARWLFRQHPREVWPALLQAAMAVALVKATVLLWQIIQATQSGIDYSSAVYTVTGLSGHKNLSASALLVLLPFNIIGRQQETGKVRLAFTAAIILSVLAILFSLSETVYVGAAAGILFAFLVRRFTPKWRSRPQLQAGVYAAGMFSALVLLSWAFSRLPELLHLTEKIQAASAQERLLMWEKTGTLIREHAVLGVGGGNWKIAMPQVGVDGLQRAEGGIFVFVRPHNDLLWNWSELGLPGLLCYGGIFGLVLYTGLRQWLAKKNANNNLLLGLACVLAYLVVSWLDFPRERPEHLVLIGLWIAYLAHRSASRIPKPFTFTIPHRFALGIGTLAMVASLYVGYHRWQGETALIDIIRHKEAGNYAAMLTACEAAYSPFYTVDNNAQPIRWYRGIAQFQLGNIEAALADFQEAETIHPYNMHVLNNTGAALIQLGRPAEAIPYLERSLQVNPRMDDARFNMAIAFKAMGDVGTAMHYLNQTTTKPQRKQQLLQSMGN